ncbi:MAG TPA: flavodoxin [Lachnospiraceae bacterium]|nr:flavodoxin [Lachnospiraceae bacterium]
MLSVLMIFSLAACGSQDGGNQGTAPQSANGGNGTENLQNPSGQIESPVKDTAGSSTETSEESVETTESKTLVVYYSATGYTESVAKYIAEATGGELFRLEPVEEYSSADLDWTDRNSRVSREHNNPEERMMDLVASTVPDWESYETIFIGYPIWWGIAAWPVDRFIADNDFTGKTVIPFCTSSSSGLGESGELLKEAAGTGEWLTGERFRSGASEETVKEWVESLSLE